MELLCAEHQRKSKRVIKAMTSPVGWSPAFVASFAVPDEAVAPEGGTSTHIAQADTAPAKTQSTAAGQAQPETPKSGSLTLQQNTVGLLVLDGNVSARDGNSAPVKVAIDTGLAVTAVSGNLAKSLNLKDEGRLKGVSLSGALEVRTTTLPYLQIGGLKRSNVPVIILDLPKESGVDILFGHDLFAAAEVSVDVNKLYFDKMSGRLVGFYRASEGVVQGEVTLVGRGRTDTEVKTVSATIDTGAKSSFLSDDIWASLNPVPIGTQASWTPGGQTRAMPIGEIAGMIFGNVGKIAYRSPAFQLAIGRKGDVTIGNDMLRELQVTIVSINKAQLGGDDKARLDKEREKSPPAGVLLYQAKPAPDAPARAP